VLNHFVGHGRPDREIRGWKFHGFSAATSNKEDEIAASAATPQPANLYSSKRSLRLKRSPRFKFYLVVGLSIVDVLEGSSRDCGPCPGLT
jgi:hypothetical protein